MGEPQNRRQAGSRCAGCGLLIRDRFLLRVHPDLEWHARCLRCAHCRRALDGSCFLRDGKTFCKEHHGGCVKAFKEPFRAGLVVKIDI
ncbi:insulin gene enhancer protein ISL-1-like [Puntigrus tetrazona]|uniref:insulin gene enhancer protein ISL-1-like n=1 Tax=Puntigrus tetrazona TaxID=1606681 RepID=UPI001C890A23|nr:insulin gene enhancer protein ISL-1-like [Puntigrus tetrazona]